MDIELTRLIVRVIASVSSTAQAVIQCQNCDDRLEQTLRNVGSTIYEVANAISDYKMATRREDESDIPF